MGFHSRAIARKPHVIISNVIEWSGVNHIACGAVKACSLE